MNSLLLTTFRHKIFIVENKLASHYAVVVGMIYLEQSLTVRYKIQRCLEAFLNKTENDIFRLHIGSSVRHLLHYYDLPQPPLAPCKSAKFSISSLDLFGTRELDNDAEMLLSRIA